MPEDVCLALPALVVLLAVLPAELPVAVAGIELAVPSAALPGARLAGAFMAIIW